MIKVYFDSPDCTKLKSSTAYIYLQIFQKIYLDERMNCLHYIVLVLYIELATLHLLSLHLSFVEWWTFKLDLCFCFAMLIYVRICRMQVNNEEQNNYSQNLKSLSVPNLVCQRPQSNFYPISKPHTPFEGTSSSAELGAFANDSVLNSSWSSLSDSVSLIPSPKLNHHDQSNPLRHFFDDCPKVQSNYLTATWPGVEETQSDRTQLSISNPISCSDFSSTTSSNHDILALSPLKLSREYGYDHVHMGLGMGVLTNASQRQMNWRPLSWEASISGPLGEVLNSTSSTPKDQSKNSFTSLNLLADDWDSRSRMEFSPTGVLQKTSLASLCSSTGSSPRAENRMLHEGTSSHCNDLNDSTLVDAPTIPPLWNLSQQYDENFNRKKRVLT